MLLASSSKDQGPNNTLKSLPEHEFPLYTESSNSEDCVMNDGNTI